MKATLHCLLTLILLASPFRAVAAVAQTLLTIPECGNNRGPNGAHAGLSSACKMAFASRAAPILVVRSGGCDWDAENGRIAGGYFFGVQRVDSVVRVGYLPAYFEDCGWKGIKCWIPGVDCSPHFGDSEFIAVDLAPTSSHTWEIVGLFLSAHCFGRSGESCKWYRASELSRFEFQNDRPVIWVSEGRHANYPSARACDKGHHSLDTCDHHDVRYTFPLRLDHDIGSSSESISNDGCVSGAELGDARAEPDALECFWRDKPFRGWRGAGRGVTGYFKYLREIAGYSAGEGK